MQILKLAAATVATAFVTAASAAVTIIPDSALVDSSSLYTTDFGSVVVTTGGGNGANVGLTTGRNDDGFRGPIPLGFTLTNFFGSDYTQFFVNNNGNITFNQGLSTFTPQGPQGATQPVIAPFFADVDTRGLLSGVVYVNTSIANEVIVTWDHVGYYNSHDNLLNTFQLVLRGPSFAIPEGEGQIGFFWGDMQWETGDASGGTGGFGGSRAAVGFGDGQQNGFVLESSQRDGISRVVANQQIWFNLTAEGTPAPVTPGPDVPPVPAIPEPQTYALMLAGLALMAWMTRRRQQTI